MPFSIPLALLLAVAAPPQAPEVGKELSAVAPLVGDEVAAVVRIDLTRWEVPQSTRRVLGKLADDPELLSTVKPLEVWVDSLKKAGASDVFLLFDLADMPGYPLAVVPLSAADDGKAIAEILSKGVANFPLRWPASTIFGKVVIAGSPRALARVREAKPAARPELLEALAACGPAPIQVAIIPSLTQRRAIEESMSTLPPALGGGPITTLTRGMSWGSLALTIDPRPTVRLVAKAKDPETARSLQKLIGLSLGFLAVSARSDPSTAELADALALMKPEVNGDKVTLESDLEKVAALVAVPVRQAREASRRSACINNMKQIGLAMHNYLFNQKGFPSAYLADKDGKPLLSWRVQILPFLDEQDLYNQFHLDEPWDSAHNKTLISKMPKVYACPSESKALVAEGKTTYLTPRGPSTIFPGPEKINIQEITDGTTATILVVDASDDLAVTWTRPDDWNIATPFTTKGLFGHHPQGTEVLLGDGGVKFIKETIALKLWQFLTTRNGAEVFTWDEF